LRFVEPTRAQRSSAPLQSREHLDRALVRHRAFGVKHAAVPLEHADAAFEERTVARPRDPAHDRQVARPGHEQANVDIVACRRTQRLDVRGQANEIGVRKPQASMRRGGDELIEAEQSAGIRDGGDHP
jgi:hypothetical protein